MHLEMYIFYFSFLKTILLGIEFQFIGLFFQHFKKKSFYYLLALVVAVEVSFHSSVLSLECKQTSGFLKYFLFVFLWVFVVLLYCAYVTLFLLPLGFIDLSEFVSQLSFISFPKVLKHYVFKYYSCHFALSSTSGIPILLHSNFSLSYPCLLIFPAFHCFFSPWKFLSHILQFIFSIMSNGS